MLTGPGGFFEIAAENVNGIEMGVVAGPHRSLRDLLAASANHGGDGSARYYLFDDGRSATFAENIGHTAAVAAGLADRYGIEPGDRVGLLGANQPGWIQGFWGTVSAGAIAVAMNGWWKGDEIRYGIELTEPKVLIADRRRLERLDSDPGVPVIGMDADPQGSADSDGGPDTVNGLIDAYRGASMPEGEIAIDDPAVILFTLGDHGPAPGRHPDPPQLLRLSELRLHDRRPPVPAVPGSDDGRGRSDASVQPAVPCVGIARLRGDGRRRRLQPSVDHRPLRRREDPAPHREARHRPMVGGHHPGLEARRAPAPGRLRHLVGSQHRRRRLGVVPGVAKNMPHRPAPCPRQRDHRIRAHRELGPGHQRGRRRTARPSRLGRLPAPHRRLAHHRRRRRRAPRGRRRQHLPVRPDGHARLLERSRRHRGHHPRRLAAHR